MLKKMLIPLLFLLFTGCSSHNQQQIYTVTAHTISHALTYKGTIAPLQIVDVQSPADGSVQKVFFNPGALVQKNQLLLTLYSPKYVADYQSAMLSYLKAKSDYTNAQSSFLGTEALWKHGLIARDDY